MLRGLSIFTLSFTALLGCAGGLCDPAGLNAALGAAAPGDTVELGSCEVQGSFTVPAGVTVRGQGPSSVLSLGPDASVVLTVEATGGPRTVLNDLVVRSEGCVGILLNGSGEVELNRVRVDAERGMALGAEGLDGLTLNEVELGGPLEGGLEPDVHPLPPYTCANADPATHGLVAVDVTEVAITDSWVRGFAAFGALFIRSEVRWVRGGIEDNMGTGLEVWQAAADLEEMQLCTSRQGSAPIEAYNGVFAGGGSVQSRGVTVCDSDAFGLMHDSVAATHTDLVATHNQFAAVWAQNAPSLALLGSANVLEDNGFAGVAALATPEVRVEGASIARTQTRTLLVGETGRFDGADGVHLTGFTSSALRNLSLNDNERVGALADLTGATSAGLVLESVAVQGTGTQFGVVVQNGTLIDGWDDGVNRAGAVIDNDMLIAADLEIAGAVGPSCFPPVEGVMGGLGGFLD